MPGSSEAHDLPPLPLCSDELDKREMKKKWKFISFLAIRLETRIFYISTESEAKKIQNIAQNEQNH